MKTQFLLFSLLSLLFNSVMISNAHSSIIYRYQIMPEDAHELNVLGNALGVANVSGINGWPVSAAEFKPGEDQSVFGVYFVVKDTLKRIEGKDEIRIVRSAVKKISLAGLRLSGTLPDLSFSDLEIFNLGFNQISGNIPVLDFPKCKTRDAAK